MKTLRVEFDSEPEGFTWFGQPKRFSFDGGLVIHSEPSTDFWQRTHYGFRRDNGHALLKRLADDFTMTTRVTWNPESQYDQCGIFARIDAANWAKASVEFEGQEPARLGSVVTSLGYSDWASQDIDSKTRSMSYRMSKRESDILIEYSNDERAWFQMRVAHLHAGEEEIEAGIYSCSPVGNGFRSEFAFIEFRDCVWSPAGS